MFRIPRLPDWRYPILILCALFTQLEGAALSSSSLESCIRDSSQSEDLQCDEKLVLTISLGGGQALATEELQLDLRCIGRCVLALLAASLHLQAQIAGAPRGPVHTGKGKLTLRIGNK
eukprot:1074740-Pelagomonas_calceolata.AAC.1